MFFNIGGRSLAFFTASGANFVLKMCCDVMILNDLENFNASTKGGTIRHRIHW
jgi:hypothetical protein